ncbi:MAG: hypothetical protein ACFFAE_22590 [Candidatus Hodarchaeota archaeon]
MECPITENDFGSGWRDLCDEKYDSPQEWVDIYNFVLLVPQT